MNARLRQQKQTNCSSSKRAELDARRKTQHTAAFTLIEIVTAIAIILVLASISSPLVGYATKSSFDSRTRAEIRAIENALEAYKADNGSYPPLDPSQMAGCAVGEPNVYTNFAANAAPVITNGAWANSRFIYQALTKGSKVYITLKPNQLITTNLDGVACTLIMDGYGHPYGYNPASPRANPGTFDFWSCGIDGKSQYFSVQSSDDIGNWR
jgi:prepilin-type N-terminal cleavage/methylation domain-containing protein